MFAAKLMGLSRIDRWSLMRFWAGGMGLRLATDRTRLMDSGSGFLGALGTNTYGFCVAARLC